MFRKGKGKVVLVFRDPLRRGRSVEEIYRGLLESLESKLDIQAYYYKDEKGLLANRKSILKLNPDVIHITSDMYFLVPLLGRAKKIITIHDIGRYKELTGIKKWVFKLLWLTLPMNFADRVITVSEYSKADILSLVSEKYRNKIQVIPNPVHRLFTYTPKEFNAEKPILLQIGSARHKNLNRIIEALNGISCKLHIIGELNDHQRKSLIDYNIEFEVFSLIPYEEVAQQYQICDLVVFVSLHEGFGMPIIEANATGRPVVCSAVCSLPEVAGDAALYIKDPTQIAQIRAGILKVISEDDTRQQLVERGLQNAKRFSNETITAAYEEMYANYLEA